MYNPVRELTLLALLAAALCQAQTTEHWYDYNWKPCEPAMARFYGTLEKTDSGWYRKDYFLRSGHPSLQMEGLFEDEACTIQNGEARYYYPNGRLQSAGRRINGRREGICISYHSNGMMYDSAYWHDDLPQGIRYRWHRNGYLADSLHYHGDGTRTEVTWWDNGALASAGIVRNEQLQGKWKFWHPNGQLAAEEVYDNGKVISKTYYNEDGSPHPDTATASREAVFAKGGMDGWRRYLENKVNWPVRYKLENTNTVTVGVQFCVNEEGKVVEVEMAVPFDPVFDEEAMEIIRKSPPWLPGLWHNIRVKAWRRQPLTFQQEE